MLIKVCGMQDAANMEAVGALRPDMMGFIFYEASPRYAGRLTPETLSLLPSEIRKVGVFVNATLENIRETVVAYGIQTVQLHGKESPDFCNTLVQNGLNVMKAIGVENKEDVEAASIYEQCCECLLFDTKSPLHGGTGTAFDWKVLEHYRGSLPFLLSGGISVGDIEKIRRFKHPRFLGIDLNSRFEISPGLKNTGMLAAFLQELRFPLDAKE